MTNQGTMGERIDAGLDAEVFVRHLLGESSPEERRLVEAWCTASGENHAGLRRRELVWELIGSAGGGDIEARVTPIRPLRAPRRAIVLAAVAAAASMLLYLGLNDSNPPLPPSQGYGTGPTEVRTVQLADGSVVRLGPSSRLEYREREDVRDLELSGQAFFVVRSGNAKPFRVSTAGAPVTVLGTRFEVEARGAETAVVVLEGRVAVGSGREVVTLEANQRAVATAGKASVVEPVEDALERTRWVGSFLAFDKTPLGEVAREIEERLGVQIEIADPVLADRTVTGWFADEAPVEVLSSLCLAVDVKCSESGGRVVMGAADSGSPAPKH
jgi:transmembrane sensor